MSEELQLNDPQTLYRRWEDSEWSPTTILGVSEDDVRQFARECSRLAWSARRGSYAPLR